MITTGVANVKPKENFVLIALWNDKYMFVVVIILFTAVAIRICKLDNGEGVYIHIHIT